MLLKKGDEMTSLMLIFVGCIVVMFVSIWVYNKKEDTAFHDTMKELSEVKYQLKEAKDQIDSNRTTVMNQSTKIQELESKVLCASDELKKFKVEIDNLQEHCAKIREQQILLKDQLANKRPVLKVTTPIPVQVVPSVKQAPQPNPETIKKLKKQLKEVSQ